jgi:hypothetical protein
MATNEYPKHLYKKGTHGPDIHELQNGNHTAVTVNSEEEEAEARDKGYGPYAADPPSEAKKPVSAAQNKAVWGKPK